ncbi:MAG: hypothetical protein Q8P41_23960 [Pseudomonadota bacterium]|nr:hypothetical protein [Pseudomonadota bacterium]
MNQSGAGLARDRGAPVVLRLLPHVHHPPARVLLPDLGEGHEARALDARGYRVTVLGGPAPAPGITAAAGSLLDAPVRDFDLVCESGAFASLDHVSRARYVEAAATVLRPGGLLFGAFPAEEGGAGALIEQLAPRFDVARLEPSGTADGWLEAIFVRR